MYRIDEEKQREKYILLIPAMLDAHFPLLKYAFYSKRYHPVIMEENEGITNLGLKYAHNDLCYPAILIVGQILKALQSGKYDVNRTVILEPQAGDACRGSNYIPVIRKALDDAGFPMVPVISLNVTNLERKRRLPITPDLLIRAVAAAYYGDLLMILSNQTEPYETNRGDTAKHLAKWTDILAGELRQGKHLSVRCIRERFDKITEDFHRISRTDKPMQKIGVVGELYIKYCHLGNWNLEQFLKRQDCEYYINGITWYALYYMDTHLLSEGGQEKRGALAAGMRQIFQYFLGLQKNMVNALKSRGFYCMDAYDVFKKKAEGYVTGQCSVGDGWLIGAEFANHALNGYNRIICGQPFGCLPSHVCGRGLYPAIRRKLPDTQYISVDYDASGTDTLVKSRIRMLLSF
ncbi:MAG: 2-hydroxyacyl-CoA dehydratase [Bacteroidales bacterium]|nr:2-hydroxyacyl-CoA dehydratase [Clostridium sp.]MCM1202511.1 2-hydroxyacyl-CoA dehydratase [Bacteroidales bacterium]